MLVTNLDWSSMSSNRYRTNRSWAHQSQQQVDLAKDKGVVVPAQVASLSVFDKLGRVEVPEATAGDVVAVVGLEDIEIGDTVCARGDVRPLERLKSTNRRWK